MTIGILAFFLVEDAPVEKSRENYISNVIYGFRPDTIKNNKTLYVTLVTFIVFNISIQIYMPYLIIYYEVSLGMANYVLIMAPAIILASVFTALWGKAYDKRGFEKAAIVTLVLLASGYVLLYMFRSTAMVFAGSLLMMSGYLSGMAMFGARIRDLTPEGYAGRLQGVRIFSQVLMPGVIGPYIGKTILANAQMITNNDGTQSFVPNANIFLGALIAIVPVIIVVFALKSKMSKKA